MSDDPVVPPALEDAIREEVASYLIDPRHPTRIAYDRVRRDFPDGGEEARGAFHRYLREEKEKREAEEAMKLGPKAPNVGKDGVPFCSQTQCPKYGKFTGRCADMDGADAIDVCVPAIKDMVLELDARRDAADPAFDEIIALCGLAKTWEYPGQVVRDVQDALKKRDDLIAAIRDDQRNLAARIRESLDTEHEQLGPAEGVEATIGRLREDYAKMIQTSQLLRACVVYARDRRGGMFDYDEWALMVEKALEGIPLAHAIENAQATEAKAWDAVKNMRRDRDAARTELMNVIVIKDKQVDEIHQLKAQVAELEENGVRMREYRFAIEGIRTDGKGNPIPPPDHQRKIFDENGIDVDDEIERMGNLRSPEQQAQIDAALADEPPPCSCSEKYIELQPGVHSKYCARAGQPLDDGMTRYTCTSCTITYRYKVDKCMRCGCEDLTVKTAGAAE